MIYEFLAKAIGSLGAVHARQLAAVAVNVAGKVSSAQPSPLLARHVMGLVFPSPLGLAAGFDKHGKHFMSLPLIGFGFAEIGSVTPLPEAERSVGLHAVSLNISRYRLPHPIPLGVSISMNRATPPAAMAHDYLKCFLGVQHVADYVTLNLGPRAGPDLHLPENTKVLREIFHAIKRVQEALSVTNGKRIPIAVKIDQVRGNTRVLINDVLEYGFDGIVLSGSTTCLAQVANYLNGQMPIISVGGICTAQEAKERLDAGASLLQIYSGLVASGPKLVRKINKQLSS